MIRLASPARTLATVATLLLAPSQASSSTDCNGNGVPDELDVVPNLFSLAAPVSYPTGVGPVSLAPADLDQDGDRDPTTSEVRFTLSVPAPGHARLRIFDMQAGAWRHW